ncbi:hypothetical protein Tco_0727939 [Tanacetum coccineum]|uniref:Reverse transcriptase domain-containing protein n=1 Tax=Tanacetum coccineum TaxID=301880 RepID=A0ABQ4YJT6_9ASTR
MSRPTGLKKLRKVGMSRRVESSEDQESLGALEDASKQGRSIEDMDADVDVSLVDETQERQNDDLMFDSRVLEDDVMHVEAKVNGKDEQSKKPDDSTPGEAVTTASIDDSVVPTTSEEITLLNSNFPNNSNVTIPRRRNKGCAPNIVKPELRTIVTPMAKRIMEELLRTPTEGYGEAIVLPEINADHFEIKTNLLQLVQANPFHGLENENPHAHINYSKGLLDFTDLECAKNDVLCNDVSIFTRGGC